jgi:hypothetical protein
MTVWRKTKLKEFFKLLINKMANRVSTNIGENTEWRIRVPTDSHIGEFYFDKSFSLTSLKKLNIKFN